jgi:hypothetical protein
MDAEKQKARRFVEKSSGIEIRRSGGGERLRRAAERPVQQGHQWCVGTITRAG